LDSIIAHPLVIGKKRGSLINPQKVSCLSNKLITKKIAEDIEIYIFADGLDVFIA